MRKLFLIFVLIMSITGCSSYKEISLDSETLASSTTTYNGSEEETTYEFNTLNNDVIMTMDEEKLNPSKSLDLTAYSGNWQYLNTTLSRRWYILLALLARCFLSSVSYWSTNGLYELSFGQHCCCTAGFGAGGLKSAMSTYLETIFQLRPVVAAYKLCHPFLGRDQTSRLQSKSRGFHSVF